jgi:hypothetical protein
MDARSVPWDATNIATLAHCDAVRRGHPLHQADCRGGEAWRRSVGAWDLGFGDNARTIAHISEKNNRYFYFLF